MAIDNWNNENMPLASTSLPQRSEEHGFSLMNYDSAYLNGVASDCQHNDMPIPLPVISMSPPPWNVPGVSQYYSKELVPGGGNLMTDASHINSSKNFQMYHHYLHEEDHKSLLCRPDSEFSSSKGYRGQPYQYNRHDYLTIPDKMTNAAFNLNSSEKLDGGEKIAIHSNNSAGGPQMLKPSAKVMNGNIGHPPLNLNFGTPLCIPNQGAASLNCPGKLDERFMTFGSEGNTKANFSSNISRINVTGNSEREFLPPINTHHNQMGSRSFLNPDFDMNGVFSSFQNNNEVISDLAQNVGAWIDPTVDHKVMFDARPSVSFGPSYDFQRSAAGDQNHHFQSVDMGLGLRGWKDIGMEIADVGYKSGLERCIALSSSPFVGSQIMQCDIVQSKASGHSVCSSPGMMRNQSSIEKLPEYNVNLDEKFSSQFSATPPLGVATGNTRGQDHLNPGIQTGMRNMTAQVSCPSVRSSLKRGAFEPPSSTMQVQRRKAITSHPFIHPSIPTWFRSAPLVPNTAHTIRPLIHTALSLTPQATQSLVHPSIPTWTKSALSVSNTPQTIPPLACIAPSLPPQACATVSLPLHDKRTSSFLPSSQTICLPHQPQTTLPLPLPLPHTRWRAPITPSAPKIVPFYIKHKDQTPELIGHKCLLCKRDLSYTPEGPIFQPSAPPAVAVLPCGHTFHNHCLERITPNDQSKDPPCIPCALSG